jgi:nucleoid-associated protein YgaU
MKPLAVFSSLAVLCGGGLLALSYQGWQNDPSVVTTMTKGDQKVSINGREAVSTPPAVTAPAAPQPSTGQTAAVEPGTTSQDSSAAQQPAPAQDAKSDTAQQPPAGEAASAGTELAPSFDIVRIEEDGSAVLAGRAAPGTTVTALLDGQAMGETVANDRGEWVILPSQPLPPGAHEVTLSQAASDGTVTQSGQSVALTVPDKPGSQPLIVLSETAKPSRVLQKPETETVAAAEPAKPEPAEEKVAAVEPPTQTTEPSQQPATASAPAPVPAPAATPSATAPAMRSARSLTVDVVDYDAQGRTTFSGKAAPGSRVRIYVSDRFTGEAEADASGAWSITPSRDIEAGTHALRADRVGADGKVSERIELPFLRESSERIAGLQAQRSGEAATTEPAVQEPQPQQPAAAESQQAATEPQITEQAPAQSKQETATAPATEKQAQGPGRVVIQPGNNLWQISRVIYGKGVQYTVIYEANKDQIRNPDLIYPGQILDTPGSNAPESIDPSCRKPLAECKEDEKGAAQ